MRATAFLAVAVLLVAGGVSATPEGTPGPERVARVRVSLKRELTSANGAGSTGALEALAPAGLAPIDVTNHTTLAHGKVRLYDERGALDRAEARAFMRVSGTKTPGADEDADDDERLSLRLVQLVVRASYHFGGAAITVVSATRPRARGKHGSGEALDFSLEGVRAATLAAYLRQYPRAGVGIYTHPKTQYVHLDVRERSYHWIDASPPRVSWREQVVRDPKQADRDASWSPALDLPEPVARR